MTLNFFSPEGYEAVAVDMLLEQGWKLEILEPEEARQRWIVSIRGVMNTTYTELRWPRHMWATWDMGALMVSLVRIGTTEDLFKKIDSPFIWARTMSRLEYTLWLGQTWEQAEQVGAQLAIDRR